VEGLAKVGYRQTVYIQERGLKNSYDLNHPNMNLVVSYVLRKWMKFFFFARIRAVFSDLSSRKIIYPDSVIMAYFLLSDGAVAYKLHQKYGTPYVVSVRNTDINVYLRYFPWLKPLARKILINADFVFLASPAYKEVIKAKFGESFYEINVAPKLRIIGNIINASWFSAVFEKKITGKPLKLIYVGEFSKNKRIESIIHAVDILNQNMNVSLTLIGNYGDNCKKIQMMASSCSKITIINRIDSIDKLKCIVDNHDIFVMCSKTETFGLAYIEAMSRGLPVIYTRGQGIDGYFPDGFIGYAVSYPIAENVAVRVVEICNNYNVLSTAARSSSKLFAQNNIIELYSSMINQVK